MSGRMRTLSAPNTMRPDRSVVGAERWGREVEGQACLRLL